MEINYFLIFTIIIITTLIGIRLQIHKVGIWSVGFFNLATNVGIHFIMFPVWAIMVKHSVTLSGNFTNSLLIINISLLSLFFGTLFAKKKELPKIFKIENLKINFSGTLFFFLLLLFIFFTFYFLTLKLINPIEILYKSRKPDFTDPAGFRYWYIKYNLSYFLYPLQFGINFLHALLITNIYQNNKNFKGFLIVFLLTIFVMFIFLSTGSRSALVFPLIIFLFITHHYYKKVPVIIPVILFIIFVPVFVVLKIMASGWTFDFIKPHISFDFIISQFMRRVSNLKNIVDFLDWFKGDFQFGYTILQFFVRPIPRLLWADKPSSIDVFFTENVYGQKYHGVMLFGGVCEMYYNFWIFGNIIWFFILGIFFYKVHFGTVDVIKNNKYISFVLIISNGGFLRGLCTIGINTVSMQTILLCIFSQFLILILLSKLRLKFYK